MMEKKSNLRYEFGNLNALIKNSKRSQIGTTLTWFFAFLIIFFIMIIFLTSTSLFSAKKAIISGENGIEDSKLENLRVQRNLINFLNNPLESDGKMQKTSEVLLSSLDPYLEDETGIYFASWKIADKSILKKLKGDINNLGNIRESLSEEFFISSNARQKDKLIFDIAKSGLGNICSDYMLVIPQGALMKDSRDFISERNFESLNWKEIFISKWTEPVEIILPYKDQKVKIKYKEMKKC